jgi:hypothetical protein
MSGKGRGRTLSRALRSLGCGFFLLTRWHSRLSTGRTPAGPQARAQGVRPASRRARVPFSCRVAAWERLIASVSLLRGNAKGFALSFPKAE